MYPNIYIGKGKVPVADYRLAHEVFDSKDDKRACYSFCMCPGTYIYMYFYTYIHACVCAYMYIFLHTFMCSYVYIYTYINTHEMFDNKDDKQACYSFYIFPDEYTFICISAFKDDFMCTLIYIYQSCVVRSILLREIQFTVFICIYIYLCIYNRTNGCFHINMYTYSYLYLYKHRRTIFPTIVDVEELFIHAHIYVHYLYIFTYLNTIILMYTYIWTYI